MPEAVRSLVVIIFLSFCGRMLVLPLANTLGYRKELKEWLILWLAISIVAFLIPHYWSFLALSFVIIQVLVQRKITSIVPAYFVLVLCLPSLREVIPGFGSINYLLEVTWSRFIILILFLPYIFVHRNKSAEKSYFRLPSDLLILAYIVLISGLKFRDPSLTEALRYCIYNMVDIFIPYYLLSRYITSVEQFKTIFFAIYTFLIILSLFAIFESAKHWLLYISLRPHLGLSPDVFTYKTRSGFLRSHTSHGSINLGYIISVAFGCGLFLMKGLKLNLGRLALFSILIVALLSTVSRGPWVAFAVLIIIYYLPYQQGRRRLFKMVLAMIAVSPLLSFTKMGEKFIALLPFVEKEKQTVDDSTISYRQELVEQASIVINRSPFFGSTDYLETTELESMRQGEGIIDLVNTYIQIALEYGYVGVCLFVLIFLKVIFGIYKKQGYLLRKKEYDLFFLGNLLLAITVSTLVLIGTVSSLENNITNAFYWAFLGLGNAYLFIVTQYKKTEDRNARSKRVENKKADFSMRKKTRGFR